MLGRILDRLIDASFILSGVLLVAITVFVLFEIVVRAVFGTSTFVVVEFVGYALAPMTTFAMARTMRGGQLIRVNLLGPSLPPKVQRGLEILCVLVTFVLVFWFARLLWQDVVLNWRRGAVSDSVARFPLWITPALTLAGLAVFLAALVAYCLRLLTGGEPIFESDASKSAGV